MFYHFKDAVMSCHANCVAGSRKGYKKERYRIAKPNSIEKMWTSWPLAHNIGFIDSHVAIAMLAWSSHEHDFLCYFHRWDVLHATRGNVTACSARLVASLGIAALAMKYGWGPRLGGLLLDATLR